MTAINNNRIIFKISPLIRITLLSLYVALTAPLPFLAQKTGVAIPQWLFISALLLGGMMIYAVMTERVILDEIGITVTYPNWFKPIWRKGWSLSWHEVRALKMRTTGQGGMVYYFTTKEGERAYLLPMRVAGFAKMVGIVTKQTGIDTTDIRPLAQPWMYFFLLFFTFFLLLMDVWTISVAMT
ncbi:MAG: hypothetical protein IGQ45_06745 [Cyanobacterium sp. T60_A2020_053]|nr:hypothetical protein [Cyanobacterium sp. T60_A2020_053]